ncbi:hypothetical protein MOMA_08951 [Moraxella macacae 0408225]|uniref:Uncharacterized protein n=1 Tax=Moraxella macacae 0408225 TaxID=1230338 RepID=L2F6I5_9GAMM|nr:hypothetical protein [Moraxella macacae]ELA08674.1 hypothetical protein MOMA_08951 [Moraxella macacae 0408225]
MKNFQPFANDSQSVSVQGETGELTFENQGEQVNFYGNATFYFDRQSLELATQLQQQFANIVAYLKQQNVQNTEHSQIITEQQTNVTQVANPFL